MCFKGQGESKAYKHKKAAKKDDKDKPDEKADAEKDKPKPGKDAKDAKSAKDGKDAKDPKDPKAGKDAPDDNSNGGSSSGDLGAAVPWPGIGSIHDIAEDIDFPQDDDVILYINAANAVVAWQKCPNTSLTEVDVAPIEATSADNGKTWTIEFSIDQVTGKSPRFKLPIKLGGAGLP
jgi:hypothetical protein